MWNTSGKYKKKLLLWRLFQSHWCFFLGRTTRGASSCFPHHFSWADFHVAQLSKELAEFRLALELTNKQFKWNGDWRIFIRRQLYKERSKVRHTVNWEEEATVKHIYSINQLSIHSVYVHTYVCTYELYVHMYCGIREHIITQLQLLRILAFTVIWEKEGF